MAIPRPNFLYDLDFQCLLLSPECFRQSVTEGLEQLFVRIQLLLPEIGIDFDESVESFLAHVIQTGEVEVAPGRNPA